MFVELLSKVLAKFDCSAPIYCFMPDHFHGIFQGETDRADTWAAMAAFKQRTGFWLRRHRPHRRWQKDFWDHLLRCDEDLAAQVRYIADNPVRKGLVDSWDEYPFTGSIGHDLKVTLFDAGTLTDR